MWIDQFLAPSFIFGFVKYGIKYLVWLDIEVLREKDTQVKVYLSNLKKHIDQHTIKDEFYKRFKFLITYISNNRVKFIIISIISTIVLNIASYRYLVFLYSYLEEIQSVLLFINYDFYFFISLIIFDLISLKITIGLMRNINKNLSSSMLFIYLLVDITAIIVMIDIQYKVGININTFFSEGMVFSKYNIPFPYLIEINQIFIIMLFIFVSSKFFHRSKNFTKILVYCVIIYFSIEYYESFYSIFNFWNYISYDAPKYSMMYVPQSLERGKLVFGVTTFIPSISYSLIVMTVLSIRILPKFMFNFFSKNIEKLSSSKNNIFNLISTIIGILGGVVTWLLQ